MSQFEEALKSNNPAHIQSIQKGIIIIELLAKEQREMSLTEISRVLDWPKSTVHGIISTLRDFDYIEQSDKTGWYDLGIRFFEVGNIVARKWDIGEVARPILKRLNEQTGETVQLAVEQQGEVLYLEKLESTNVIRLVSQVGSRLPMHCSGLGKVLMAYMDESRVRQIIRDHGLAKFTDYTISTQQALFRELELVRERGYAMDNNEIMIGLRCIAFPIFDGNGDATYSISISGLIHHLDGTHLERCTQLLKKAANDISTQLASKQMTIGY